MPGMVSKNEQFEVQLVQWQSKAERAVRAIPFPLPSHMTKLILTRMCGNCVGGDNCFWHLLGIGKKGNREYVYVPMTGAWRQTVQRSRVRNSRRYPLQGSLPTTTGADSPPPSLHFLST